MHLAYLTHPDDSASQRMVDPLYFAKRVGEKVFFATAVSPCESCDTINLSVSTLFLKNHS
jgi:hypothetical protein